jgi:hypothetical protein
MELYIFKTNIIAADVWKVAQLLSQLKGIGQWNIDFEDCDKVLRVESLDIKSADIANLLWKRGYVCEEL